MRKQYLWRSLATLLLLLVAGSGFGQGNLSGKYTTDAEHDFSAGNKLEEVFRAINKSEVKKLILTGGHFSAEDHDWLAEKSIQFKSLTELRIESTMESVTLSSAAPKFDFKALEKIWIAKVAEVPSLFTTTEGGYALKEISFPDATLVKEKAFSQIMSVEYIALPQVTKIDNLAFESCRNLKFLGLGAKVPEVVNAEVYKYHVPAVSQLRYLSSDGLPLEGEEWNNVRETYLNDAKTTKYSDGTGGIWNDTWDLNKKKSLQPVVTIDYERIVTYPDSPKAGDRVHVTAIPKHGKKVTQVKVFRRGDPSQEVSFDPATMTYTQPNFEVEFFAECADNDMSVVFHYRKEDTYGTEEGNGKTFESIVKQSNFMDPLKPIRLDNIYKIEVKSGAFLSQDYTDFEYYCKNELSFGKVPGLANLKEFVVHDVGMSNHDRGYSPLTNIPGKLENMSLARLNELISPGFKNFGKLERLELTHTYLLRSESLSGCRMLKKLKAPVMEYVKEESMANNTSLQSISFPILKELDGSAFEGCTRLSLLELGATPPRVIGSRRFDGLKSGRIIRLVKPDGTPLEGAELRSAVAAYMAVDDGDTSDALWYGWQIVQGATYTITSKISDGKGQIDVQELQQPGLAVEVKVEPADGQMLDLLTYTPEGESPVDITAKMRFEMPAKNVEVTAKFVPAIIKIVVDGVEKSGTNLKKAICADEQDETKHAEILANVKTLEIVGGSITSATWSDISATFAYLLSVESFTITKEKISFIADLPDMQFKLFTDAMSLKRCHLEGVRGIPSGSLESKSLEEIKLPDTEEIGEGAFEGSTRLLKIEAPKVKLLGKSAFAECSSLQKVEFPLLTDVPDVAFFGCKGLREAIFPDATGIGYDSFHDCAGLVSVSYPKVTAIGDNAFEGCVALRRVELPQLVSVSREAFKNCKKLESIDVLKADYIHEMAFFGAEQLVGLRLLEVKTLAKESLSGCKFLEELSVPQLQYVESDVFKGCGRLSTLCVGAEPVNIDPAQFNDCPKQRILKFVDPSGELLDQEQAAKAQKAYQAFKDGNTDDNRWCGWIIPNVQPQAYPVSFTVMSKEMKDPMEGVQIRVARKSDNIEMGRGVTTSQGVYELSLPDETYIYTCTEENCIELSGEFVVSGEGVARTLEMEHKPAPAESFKVIFSEAANGKLSVMDGAVAIVTGQSYPKGTELRIVVIGDKGYKLGSLTVGGVDRTADVMNGELPFTLMSDTEIKATFVKGVELYAVTFATPENGDLIVQQGEQSVSSGDQFARDTELVVKVKAHDGYSLDRLIVGGEDRTLDVKDGIVTIVITKPIEIVATFKKVILEQFEVTFDTPENGDLIVLRDGKPVSNYDILPKGTELVVKVKAHEGYYLAKLMVGMVDRKAGVKKGELSFTLMSDTKIVATFVEGVEMFAVTFAAPENGDLIVLQGESSVSSGDKFVQDTKLVVKVKAHEGYYLDKLMVGEEDRTADVKDGSVGIVITEPIEIVATFVKEQFAVTFATPENGDLIVLQGENSVSSGDKFAKDTELVVKVKAHEGYHLAKLMVGEVDRTADVKDGSVSIVITEPFEIVATFVKVTEEQFAVTFAAPVNGDLIVLQGENTVSSGDKFPKDTELVVKVKAHEGYRLHKLMVSDVDRADDVKDGSISFTIMANTTIVAEFTKIDGDNKTDVVASPFATATVYPNPFASTLRLNGLVGAERVVVYSVLGSRVHTSKLAGEQEAELDLSHLPEGVYLVVLESHEGRRAFRVQKQ